MPKFRCDGTNGGFGRPTRVTPSGPPSGTFAPIAATYATATVEGPRRSGGIGRRASLRGWCPTGRGGSSPPSDTHPLRRHRDVSTEAWSASVARKDEFPGDQTSSDGECPQLALGLQREGQAMNSTARRMFELIEPIGAIPYSADEPNEAMFALGFTNYWDTYFAGRAAPLGRVPEEVVDALFYNFAPGEVARHIPKVWLVTTPEGAIDARQTG